MKKAKLLSNQIIEEYKLNLNLNSFNDFIKSFKYLGDVHILWKLCNEKNEDINDVIDIIKRKYPVYDLTDLFCYFIHLLNNKDIFSYYLTDNELELLLAILAEDESLIDIGYDILIYNYRIKYSSRINEILRKKRLTSYKVSLNLNSNDFYNIILNLIILKKSYFLTSSKKTFVDKLFKQNQVYNFLVELGHKHFADLLIKYLSENDYNSLYNLINTYQLGDSTKKQIEGIISKPVDEKYDLSDFDLSFLGMPANGEVESRLFKKTLNLASQFKTKISNMDSLDNNTLKALLEIKEMYKTYSIDSEYLTDKYAKEKTILNGACTLLQLAFKENINVSKINTKTKLIELIKKDNKNLDVVDVIDMLILQSCTDKALNQQEAFKQAKDILGINLKLDEVKNLSYQEKLIKYRNNLFKLENIASLSEKEIQYEIFMQMFEYNQKRILDLIYQDIQDDSFDIFLLELKEHLNADKYDELVTINENYKKLENESNHKPIFEDNNLNNASLEIKRLKEAYEHISLLEQTYHESFDSKKQNICEEILRLQTKEINILLDRVMSSENKSSKSIEVELNKTKFNRVVDKLPHQAKINLKEKK